MEEVVVELVHNMGYDNALKPLIEPVILIGSEDNGGGSLLTELYLIAQKAMTHFLNGEITWDEYLEILRDCCNVDIDDFCDSLFDMI